jgi:hypothetical protein
MGRTGPRGPVAALPFKVVRPRRSSATPGSHRRRAGLSVNRLDLPAAPGLAIFA